MGDPTKTPEELAAEAKDEALAASQARIAELEQEVADRDAAAAAAAAVDDSERVEVKAVDRIVTGSDPSKPTITDAGKKVFLTLGDAKRIVLAGHGEVSSRDRKKLDLD